MEKYSAPSMEFDELVFFEKIASDCWFSQNFYINIDGDQYLEDNEKFCPPIKITTKHGQKICSVKGDRLFDTIKRQFFHNSDCELYKFFWQYGGYNGYDPTARSTMNINGIELGNS